MNPSDEELVRRVRERDAAAFEALLGRHREHVRRRLVSMLRDPGAAEDLAQDAFLRVWTRADQWDGRGSFIAWLYRIANNLALNYLRSVRRRHEIPLEPPADEEEDEGGAAPAWMVDAATPDPSAILDEAERREHLRRLVARLPEEKREVLRLVQEEEMEIRTVAETLGVPEGTVKSRLHYARKQLARGWAEMEAEEERL